MVIILHNIIVYSIFNQINVALVSRNSFQEHEQTFKHYCIQLMDFCNDNGAIRVTTVKKKHAGY